MEEHGRNSKQKNDEDDIGSEARVVIGTPAAA